MKFKLIEKEKKGFARYCPTFTKAYHCIANGISYPQRKIRKMADGLQNEDMYTRQKAQSFLAEAAFHGADISCALPHFAKKPGMLHEGTSSLEALNFAIKNEKSRNAAINALMEILQSERYADRDAALQILNGTSKYADLSAIVPALIRHILSGGVWHYIAELFEEVLDSGINISPAIPLLCGELSSEDYRIKQKAIWVLSKVSGKSSAAERTHIINSIISMMRSPWFEQEMLKNSPAYEDCAERIAQLLNKIKEAEQKKAA